MQSSLRASTICVNPEPGVRRLAIGSVAWAILGCLEKDPRERPARRLLWPPHCRAGRDPLAGYAFRISLAGLPIFRDSILPE